jgi:hypothetical protein
MTETSEDVRIDADGLTVQGKTLQMIEAFAQKLGVTPVEAIRLAVDDALARDERTD